LTVSHSCRAVSEAIQAESDVFDADATDSLLTIQERLKELIDPSARHAGLFNLVEGAAAAYKAANDLQAVRSDRDLAREC
jgi:hypothetical protein